MIYIHKMMLISGVGGFLFGVAAAVLLLMLTEPKAVKVIEESDMQKAITDIKNLKGGKNE